MKLRISGTIKSFGIDSGNAVLKFIPDAESSVTVIERKKKGKVKDVVRTYAVFTPLDEKHTGVVLEYKDTIVIKAKAKKTASNFSVNLFAVTLTVDKDVKAPFIAEVEFVGTSRYASKLIEMASR